MVQFAYIPIWDTPESFPPELALQPREQPAPEDNGFEVYRSYAKLIQTEPWDFYQLSLKLREKEISLNEVHSILMDSKIYDEITKDLLSRDQYAPYYINPPGNLYKVQRDHARRLQLQIQYLISSGKEDSAAELVILWIENCHLRMGVGRQVMIDAIITKMIYGLCLENLDAQFKAFRPEHLGTIIILLEHSPDSRKIAWNTIKEDFQFSRTYFAPSSPDLKTLYRNFGPTLFAEVPIPAILFQKHRTLNLLGEKYMIWFPFLAAENLEKPNAPWPDFSSESKLPQPLVWNRVGIWLLGFFEDYNYFELIVEKHLRTEALAKALQIKMALYLGNPAPFETILDPFDGNPMRISKDGQWVYSVGKDQIEGTKDDLRYEIQTRSNN